jgi:lactoylglutathione lyase
MRIEHVALWTHDVEALRRFYERYFGAVASAPYVNARTEFQSYFLAFASGSRLEIMQSPNVSRDAADPLVPRTGFTHIALVVGDMAAVDALTARLAADGFRVLGGPRRTGDGYYESVVLDPDGNRLELTANEGSGRESTA